MKLAHVDRTDAAAARYLARLSTGSRPAQASALRRAKEWADHAPWERWTRDAVLAYRATIAELVAPATARRWLAALRGVLREALGADAAAAWRDVPPVRGARAARGRQLAPTETRAVAEAAGEGGGPRGARDRAIVSVLVGLGLRRVEVCRATLADLVDADDVLVIRGKGGRERRVPLPPSVRAALVRWCGWRGTEPGPLFCAVYRGRLRVYPLDPSTIHRIWRRATRSAGVEATTHDGRRTFASELLDQGIDLATVQALLGHASPATSARYDRRGERALRAAMSRIDLLD